MDLHALARRPLTNRFTMGVSSFINCPFLGAKETNEHVDKWRQTYNTRDIVKG